MLDVANLRYDDAAGFGLRLSNENLPSLRGENVSRLRSVHETGQLCREWLFAATPRPRNQIGMREPILFIGSAQISERGRAGKTHFRIAACGSRIANQSRVRENGTRWFPKSRPRLC